MSFVADESVDYPIVKLLRGMGFEVFFIAEKTPGISDDQVLEIANKKKAILITSDKDFGGLIYRQKFFSYGILLLRFAGLKQEAKCRIVRQIFERNKDELPGSFSVAQKSHLRIRKLNL